MTLRASGHLLVPRRMSIRSANRVLAQCDNVRTVEACQAGRPIQAAAITESKAG